MTKPHYTPGNKYGRLTILARGPKFTVFCRCECGVVTCPAANDLKYGLTRSCGCLQRETVMRNNPLLKTTHSMVNTGTYRSWAAMKSRCSNPSHHANKNYKARGIDVCPEWADSFETFLKDMGERPPGMTLDRKNNDEGYSKSNCRWATYSEQSNNTRQNIRIDYLGESLTIAQWSRRIGIPASTINWRLTRGWPIERILARPKRGTK